LLLLLCTDACNAIGYNNMAPFEEGVFERDEVSVLHEDVVRVEVEH